MPRRTTEKFRHALFAPAAVLAAGPTRAMAGGWSFPLPPNLVTADPGRRCPVFLVGEAVSFRLDKSVKRNEVSDYRRETIEKAGARETLALKAKTPGRDRLYLYGPKGKGPWGGWAGGTTFIVFRETTGSPKPTPKGATGGSCPYEDDVWGEAPVHNP